MKRIIRVGELTLRVVDPLRTMHIGGVTRPRAFAVVVKYPIGGRSPFPLIIFGHGFAVSPNPYALLLDAWVKAGFVVAAPVFPLENSAAPGGPNETDLPNQPGDVSLLISSLFTPSGPSEERVARMVDLSKIAVAGQSDGGDTALAVAYDPSVRDPRIRAAVILSGAEDPFSHPFVPSSNGPPMLAVQGTADTINPPYQTYQYFGQAPSPKYLLKLIGAGHLPPYTVPGSELSAVEHASIAFINDILRHRPGAFKLYVSLGAVGPGTTLTSAP